MLTHNKALSLDLTGEKNLFHEIGEQLPLADNTDSFEIKVDTEGAFLCTPDGNLALLEVKIKFNFMKDVLILSTKNSFTDCYRENDKDKFIDGYWIEQITFRFDRESAFCFNLTMIPQIKV